MTTYLSWNSQSKVTTLDLQLLVIRLRYETYNALLYDKYLTHTRYGAPPKLTEPFPSNKIVII